MVVIARDVEEYRAERGNDGVGDANGEANEMAGKGIVKIELKIYN